MSAARKIRPVPDAAAAVRAAQAAGEIVVMCHGCFDIVHPGHVRHLQHAAKQGDRLLVTITGDAALNKGEGRPLIPQELRAENLAALDCVDWVAINTGPTAVELLELIRPDVYVKGREYEHNRDPRFLRERAAVERLGGRVVFTSGDVIFSSTALIAALEESAHPLHAALRRLSAKHDLRPAALERLIQAFLGKRVLVIGETIRDTYVICDQPEIAGESPCMSLRPLEHRTFDGGAAAVALHLAAMGAKPVLLTGLPRAPESEALRRRLSLAGVEVEWVFVDQPIIEKQRFLVGAMKMMKLDLGGPLTLDAAHRSRFISAAEDLAAHSDAVIVADFGQGLFTPAMLEESAARLRPVTELLVGDVNGRRSNLLSMRGMDLLCPSESELREAVHNFDEGLSTVAARVLHQCRAPASIITMGAEGLTALADEARLRRSAGYADRLTAEHVPAFTAHAIDELGCGDALLAASTLTLAAGGSLWLAAILGNIAAAAQARRLGNAVISAADLREGIARLGTASLYCQPEPVAMAAL